MSLTRAPLEPGTTIGGYVVEQLLGHGGMGDVYLARDLAQSRLVALKVLPADAAHDVRRRDRLQHEGRVLQSLRHPNICSVYEVGEDGGRVFLAMEYVEGRTLHEVALHDKIQPPRVIEIACQLAAALEAARQAGVVHRDLKGANVMVLPTGDIKVLDFGLAKFAASSEQRLINPVSRPTDPGLIFGTAEFMSPEQALGREVDHRSDLFSFGVILYELLTGALPFKGGTRMELFWSIVNTQPAPIEEVNPAVPPELGRLIARLLEKDARGRPSTAQKVLEELEALRPTPEDDRKRAAARRQLWIARIAGSAVGIGLALALLVPSVMLSAWVDDTRDHSAMNAGSIWISTDVMYDMTSVVARAVRPTVDWIGNDGRVLYSTAERRRHGALWLKVPGEAEPRLLAQDAGEATVAGAGEAVFFARSAGLPGLYRSTLAGEAPVRVANGTVSHPKASRDGDVITFVRHATNGYTLWAIPAAGGEPYQLSPMVAAAPPFVSPDLKRMAIQQADDVLLCDIPACGNQETLPVTSLMGWTPDASALVHQGTPGVSNIWVTKVADGTLQQVTRFGDETATSIAWSSDGHRVAVSRQRGFWDLDWFGLFGR